MPALFDLLENETHPGVRAVLGHWLVGYVHPFPDASAKTVMIPVRIIDGAVR